MAHFLFLLLLYSSSTIGALSIFDDYFDYNTYGDGSGGTLPEICSRALCLGCPQGT